MFCNYILSFFQNLLSSIYKKSVILKSIDILIGICIYSLIVVSIFFSSDCIGYFALITIFLTVIKLLTKQNERFELSIGDKFLLIYFIFVVISLAGSTLFSLSLKGFIKTLTYLGFYVSLVHYFKNNIDKIKYIFITLGVCVLIETVIAFLQNFACVPEISGWQDMSRLNPEEVMTRVYGTLKPYNPNLFGGYLVATIPVFIGLFKKNRIYAIISGIFSIIALIFTGCRGSYIALFVELVVFSIILYNELKPALRKIFSVIYTLGASFLCFIITVIPALHARVFSIFAMRGDSSNSFRFNVYNSCIQMFKDNWLLGIGIGNQNFREIYGLYMKTGFDALSAYNIYLETAVESGIFALIAFLGFIITLLYTGLKNRKSMYTLAALISIIGILIHGFVDTVFFRPQIQFVFWIMAAILRGGYGSREN